MTDDEELFDHQVTPWTAGQLRAALEGVPDDMPVRVWVAEDPGGDTVDEQVVVSAFPWVEVDVGPTGSAGHICMPGATAADIQAKLDTGELQSDHFAIGLEFPSGQYCRMRADG
jgi:Family of unknown function (DUF6225)